MGKGSYWRVLISEIKALLKMMRTTAPSIFVASTKRKEVTEEYPDPVSSRRAEDLPTRYRGFLKNDISRCSGCLYCTDICPVDCIRIETEPGPDRNQSWVAVFDIDH